MIRRLLPLIFLLATVAPAEAHKLKVFATVEDNAIVGYAFFVGGSRAQGTDWTAKTAEGTEIAHGQTGDDGTYHIDLPEKVTSAITVTVDTHEGHIASATLPAARFGPVTAGAATVAAPADPSGPAPGAVPQSAAPATDAALAHLVAAAVQHEIEPLQEQIEEMDLRLRYSDIVSAICLILGLAGIGLYVRSRRA